MGSRRLLYARLAIPLVLLLFGFGVILADRGLSHLRLDLTEDRRFTLSPVSERLLEGLQEPVALRFYASSALTDVNPAYASHAARVRALLEEMERLAGGKLTVTLVDPAPYSAAEDRAAADGIEGLPSGDGSGDLFYFGLAGNNAVDRQDGIGFLSLDRAPLLEYDLVSLISGLAQVGKPRLGLYSSLPLDGNPLLRQPPQAILESLGRQFEIAAVALEQGSVPEDLDLLMVVQPTDLAPAAAYALDQYVLRGGRLLLFLDPFSEQAALASMVRRQPPVPPDFSGLAPLLAAWGVAMADGRVAADSVTARRVVVGGQGRQSVTDYVVWLSLPQRRLAAEEPMTEGVGSLNLNTAGILEARGEAGTHLRPLAQTSSEAEELPVERIAVDPDPQALLAAYRPGGVPLTLAARLQGPAESAFPDGPPAGVPAEAERLLRSARDLDLVLVADSDLLFDNTWISGQGAEAAPMAGNGALVVNALEVLNGSLPLNGLRGRGVAERPFTVIEDMRREAERALRQREQALMTRIDTAQQEMGAIEESMDGGVILSEAQRGTMRSLRDEVVQARLELRAVQRGLLDAVAATERRIQMVNVLAVPLLVALVGLVVLLVRRHRALGRAARGRG